MLRSPDHVKDYIPLEMLDYDFGGQWKYEFNFDTYWSTLIDFCGIAADGTRTHPSRARQDTTSNAKRDMNHSTQNNSDSDL